MVEPEPYVWAVARYLELNAVKTKQAQKPEDYPCSSCRANISGKENELISRPPFMTEAERGVQELFATD